MIAGSVMPGEHLEVTWKGELQRFRAEPGDAFAIHIDALLSNEQVERIHTHLVRILGEGTRVVVLSRGMRLELFNDMRPRATRIDIDEGDSDLGLDGRPNSERA